MRSKLFISIALLVVALHRIDGAPVPKVTLTDVPTEVLIGEDFKFKVTFQNVGNAIGFGPFIDVVLDAGGANLKKSCNTCDGISFFSAKVIGINGGPVSFATPHVSANCNPTPTKVQLTHPFASSGIQLLPVTVPAGGQLIAIQLPFGSYDPTQPVIVVEVTAHVSPLADEGVPLTISARGGFQYGADALNNAPPDWPIVSDMISGNMPPSDQQTDSSMWGAQATTTPKVMVIKKQCLAPESETATGPNYPRTYTITIDIADGQSIANLTVQDLLPNNVQYQGSPLQVKIHSQTATQVTACGAGLKEYILTPPGSGPGGTLTVAFCNPIVGAPAPPDDVTISFKVYVPDKDASGNPVLPANCTPVDSVNGIHAEGDWTQTPADPCDTTPPPPIHVINDVASACSFSDKCLTIRKTVTDISTGLRPKPGDTLQYVYIFQISDYLTIGGLTVTDFLADGQNLVPGSAQLTVKDQFGTKTGTFPAAAISSTPDPTGALKYCRPPVLPPFQTPAGGTILTFRISQAMGLLPPVIPTQNAGILTGGYAAGPPMSSQSAIGTVIFRAKIRDDFQFPVPTGADKYVDKDDPINNCIVIDGQVYQNVNRPNIPSVITGNAHDDSKTNITIVRDTPKKTVYSVKRGGSFVCRPSGPVCSNSPSPPQEVRPGDVVTFRIQKTIPTSDAENLTIKDWLPLPVFDVNDPDANGALGPSWNVGVIPPCAPAPPGPGNVCRFTPSDTLGLPWSTAFPTLPTLVVGPAQTAANSIEVDYGSFNDPSNQPRRIDLLFTSTITYQPFADGLSMANEMQECETNTFGDQFCQEAVAEVKVREPKLVIKKGVVATDNPYGVFNPPLIPTGKWKPFGVGSSCPRFNGTIVSAVGLTSISGAASLGGLINSNLYNVDANDWVTFAIAIENTGGAPAYDIQLDDIIPLNANDSGPLCFTPDYPTLCVRRGSGGGTQIPFTTHLGGHGRTIIDLTGTPLDPLTSITAGTGTNIIIITFNAQLLPVPDIQPGCCDNRTDLLHYSSTSSGPDFVGAGFTPPFSDTATVCVGPKALAKCIVQTSEPHTAPQNSGSGAPPVAIGEIVRYRLIASVPEGVSPSYQIKDLLPPGLSYLDNPTVGFVSTNPANLTSSTLSGAGLNFSGNESTTKCAPNPAPVLTFPLPSGAVTVVSGSGGDTVTFDLGTLTNIENDPDLELVVIEFNALVNNIPSNVNGTVLTNTFEFNVNGQSFDQNNSISVDAKVVEPNLVLQKGIGPVDLATGLNTVTVTLTNTGTTDAFDVHMTDTLPTGLSISGSPSVTVSPSGCAAPATPVVSGSTITVDVPKIPAASSCAVQLTFTVQATSQCFTNTAQVTYSSLPGGINSDPAAPVGTQPNSTGSVTPCLPVANGKDCERIYNASGQASINTGCTPGCASRPAHMVSWWPLDETSGNTVMDVIAGHNGTTSATIGSDPYIDWAPKVGSALFFSYSNASVPGNPYNFGTGSFSIDGWVRGGDHNPGIYLGIVDKLASKPPPKGFAFFVGDNNKRLQFTMGNGTLSPATFTSNPKFTYNQWQHVAVTVQRTGVSFVGTFYINGAQEGTFTPPATSVNNGFPLIIGAYRQNAVPCKSCEVALDEIEIFDDVVSPTDIKAIFDADRTGKCRQP